jgi:chloramphenicol 3-O phosphotransferase
MTKCILLNGTSSSGKTTVSKALQQFVPDLAHVGIGNIYKLYIEMFREDYPHPFDWSEGRYKRQVALREMLVSTSIILLKQGFSVCIDTVLDGRYHQEHMEYYLSSLQDFKPIFIGVKCDLPVLEIREKERGDRPVGLARSQLEEGVHENRPYDFTVDNTSNTPLENAKIIFGKVFV